MKNTLSYAGLGILVILAILGKSAVMLVSVLGMGLMFRVMHAAPLMKQLVAITLGALVASLLAEAVHTLYHMIEPASSGPGNDQGGFFVSATLVGLINAGVFGVFLLLLEWIFGPRNQASEQPEPKNTEHSPTRTL